MTVVLFDMDGTLSPARKPVEPDIVEPLLNLSEKVKVGIVTGSGLNYIKEQADPLLSIPNIHILPCNGTQHYLSGDKLHDANMKEELGEYEFGRIIQEILTLQAEIAYKYPVPLTGHFVDYRGSMINWCPIGRNATTLDREKFQRQDKQCRIRAIYLDLLREAVTDSTTIALGGNTSFDIYPNGWDKTYALRHFEGEQVYFVGDKCTGDGNDRQICEAVGGWCYPVSSPADTIDLINNILLKSIN